MDKQKISARIDKKLIEKTEKRAAQEHRTRSNMIEWILKQFFEGK